MSDLVAAYEIAATADVATPENSVVLYSISYQLTDRNKKLAFQYVREHPESMMLDDTECGQKLIALGLETGSDNPPEELMKIWRVASERFIASASGNITAFVDNADKRSVFISVELPLLLKNDRVRQINKQDKFEFAKRFTD